MKRVQEHQKIGEMNYDSSIGEEQDYIDAPVIRGGQNQEVVVRRSANSSPKHSTERNPHQRNSQLAFMHP